MHDAPTGPERAETRNETIAANEDTRTAGMAVVVSIEGLLNLIAFVAVSSAAIRRKHCNFLLVPIRENGDDGATTAGSCTRLVQIDLVASHSRRNRVFCFWQIRTIDPAGERLVARSSLSSANQRRCMRCLESGRL